MFIPWLPDRFMATFEWRTDVLEMADGTEQRLALWNHPKVTFDLEYNLVGNDIGGDTEAVRRSVRSLLANSPDELLEIPLRYEAVFLAANVTAGADTLLLNYNRAIDWVTTGGKVYIETDEDEDGYTATIQGYSTVGSNVQLDLDTPAPSNLSSSSVRVCPVVTLQPNDLQALGRYRIEQGAWSVSGVLQDMFMFNQGTGITPQTHEDLIVWTREALQDGTQQIGEAFQAGWTNVGMLLIDSNTLYPKARVERDLTFSVDGIDEWRWFKSVLFTIFGRFIPFFRPTFRDDLELAAQPASPTTALLVNDEPDYQPWFEDGDTYRRLALFMSDGSIDTVRVTNVTDNLNGTLTLTLSAAYSRGTDTITKLAFLESVRLGTDVVVMTKARGLRASIRLQTLTGDWVVVPPEV